ncbi:hypothetical protein AB6A40_004423 [Gnathostoma spinigerum]|uniref:Organic solute transporter alpha-like protein n=1 Tax=Gnathostoma spinigerum TaxID=75299 RepID=A0ABD6ECE9_9BILA
MTGTASAATVSDLFASYKLPPCASEWISSADSAYLVAIAFGTVATVAVVVASFVHLFHIYRYVQNELIQKDLITIDLLFPIVGICSLIGMYLPRSAFFMFAICLTYIMVCLKAIMNLTEHLFKSLANISSYLLEHGRKINPQAPPLCCCCFCCPYFDGTKLNLNVLRWMVLQSPFLRIILEIALIIAFLERDGFDRFAIVVNVIEVCSMLTATYACQMMMVLVQDKLEPYKFGAVFKFVNITQVFFTLQKLIFDLIGKYHGFDGMTLIGPSSKAMFWNNFALTLEMLLLCVVAGITVNPRKSAFFDGYQTRTSMKDSVERPRLSPPHTEANHSSTPHNVLVEFRRIVKSQ